MPKSRLDSLARSLETYSDSTARTSLYIRTSKDTYESMEDLWFKAYAVNAQHQLLSAIDQTLYVQLIHEKKDSIVWQEKYPIEEGITNGHIYLDDLLPEGNYWLCAYSAHSLTAKTIRRIRIVKNVTELLRKKTHTDSLPQKIQFSLLPEGGFLLSGVTNRVAFKAVGENGQPCAVSGSLLDGNKIIAQFKSTHAGMGSFRLRPESGSTYYVRLDAPFADTLYPLPEIRKEGLSFRLLNNNEDSITFRIYQQGAEKQLFYFRLQTRGITQVMASAEIKDSMDIKLPLQEVASGIAEATLFDHRALPVAERLLYVKQDNRLSITATLSQKSYGTKRKVSLQIHAADEQGKPVIAQLGATAYDRIYHRPAEPNDIQTHYLLFTQLKGHIYDPGYYFDTSHADRKQALDLLLLTQGWRSYSWSEEALKRMDNLVLSDSTSIELVALKKKARSSQQAVMLFDAEQQQSQMTTLDNKGSLQLSPEILSLSGSIYIRHYGEKRDFEWKTFDPFEQINKMKPWQKINYPLEGSPKQATTEDQPLLARGSIKLKAVEIQGKKATVFRDKYIGHLDSMAKYDGLTDRAHGSWLNCPVAGCGKELPIEGKTYITWSGPNPPASHPFSFNSTNTKYVVYHYPQYTEEELLKMNGQARVKGFYPKKEFYQPDYEKEQDPLPDYRNTLLWAPNIITDENGNATLEFFTSDINSAFYGIVEGISANGILGKATFEFIVTK
ncbi:hypothetical protein SAMN04488055_3520 [Chitinophaga niabensis]|uniref:MG2 domain-containing protein n=1 Tax=Chitinophaga niabensis TaxID=536979 RepID=A0A1N6J0G7_9BACT|nr:hypothetical protein SAMN04488055_3520 [Chitinophaga niabensis]